MTDPSSVHFDALFDSMAPRVLAIAYQFTGDAGLAEDALQETFLAVHRGISRFRGDSAIETWIYRIAVNEAKRVKRKVVRGPAQQQTHREVAQPDHADGALRRENTELLYHALDQLPSEQRDAICLLAVRGMSGSVAASVLGVPQGTIYSRAHAARRQLHRLLGE